MHSFTLRSSLAISHHIIQSFIKAGDIVIDATCGNGHDTLFLANLVGENGKVYGFDIQNEALKQTNQKLRQNNLSKQVQLILDSHENIDYHVNEFVDGAMFNLGYLPGVKSKLITLPQSTLTAVKKILKILKTGGIITIVFYLGHEGGQEELDVVRDYLTSLPQNEFAVSHLTFVNQVNNPPQLIMIQRLRRENNET